MTTYDCDQFPVRIKPQPDIAELIRQHDPENGVFTVVAKNGCLVTRVTACPDGHCVWGFASIDHGSWVSDGYHKMNAPEKFTHPTPADIARYKEVFGK